MKELIKKIKNYNTEEYNYLKCVEELAELSEVLLKKVNKKQTEKEPKDQEIIDEIGDCIIRLNVLTEIFGENKIDTRIHLKLNQFKTYIENGEHNGRC